ncbi:hypothetical protein BJV82DRAFT_668037 [Fennellomyces sp. T-0311]|nr:hypothetical protein BJV82DRAFT_668037 [Fennellomyces sp. T-0311]
MKDVGIKFIEIVPADTVLDFMGQAKQLDPMDDDDSQKEAGSILLKGEALFTLTRPLKIRGMSVKFKGASQTHFRGSDIQTPLLPKLKQILFGRTTLPAGEHVIPFLLEVPNIYPATLSIKRAQIYYKVELAIAIGLQKKSITAEHPIEIRRHLLRCKEMAPLVETQIIEDTVPAKFHYEIDAPQIVCLEQGSIPLSIKYLCFASQKPVRNIRTQLRQIELYSPFGSSADARTANPYRKFQNIADTLIMSGKTHKQYIKRTVPALLHTVDNTQEKSTWKRPIILRHKLQKLISSALESPLITICHELEITFQFEHQFENIRAKIPIVIASIPPNNPKTNLSLMPLTNGMPQYHFERDESRLHDSFVSVVIEEPIHVEEVDPVDDSESLRPGAHYSLIGEPRLPVTSSSINLLADSLLIDHHHRQKKDSIGRSIRKFASANELSSLSRHSSDDDDSMVPPLERPRTTTPIVQRRRAAQQQWLRPIDVDLANGLKKPHPQIRQHKDHPQHRHQENLTTIDINLMKSKARLQQVQRNSKRTGSITAVATKNDQRVPSRMKNAIIPEDAASTGSDNTSQSSRFAPSQDSSTTDRSDDDVCTLKTRPPSFVFSAAPGLPSETELRPQNAIQTSLVEEQFIGANSTRTTMSPTMATIASSTLLSPRTSYALQRKSRASNNGIPLSTATMSGGYKANINTRESSTLDAHDEVLRRIACTQDRLSMQPQPPPPRSPLPPLPPLPKQPPRPSEDNNPYVYLELPPLPSVADFPAPPVLPRPTARRKNPNQSSEKLARRMTKLYVEDSDDEVLDPSPPVTAQPIVAESAPLLPRLSLGTAFDISLDLDTSD